MAASYERRPVQTHSPADPARSQLAANTFAAGIRHRGRLAGSYVDAHPEGPLLVIEVAESRLKRDRAKAALYAAAAVLEYWILTSKRASSKSIATATRAATGRCQPLAHRPSYSPSSCPG